MSLFVPFLLAMIVTMASLPLFSRFATRWRIVDNPGARKLHSAPVPRVGGLAMAMGILAAALIAMPVDHQDRSFLLAAGVLTFFGAIDDRFDLDYRLKLVGQLIAAAMVVIGGDIQIHYLSLDDRLALPEWLSLPLTFFFLVGITNAINLADGLDGLAGGTTFLCLCALALLAGHNGQSHGAVMALAFAGAVLGFLRYNTFPASVFMGDAGSQLLGFAVGVLSLRATQEAGSAISAATPVLLLALPILDTLSVMVLRMGEGRSPFSADNRHIHHKLLGFGFNHHEAVMLIYAIQAALLLLAYQMRFESDVLILSVVSLFFVLSIALLQLATRRGWRLRAAKRSAVRPLIFRIAARVTRPEYLARWTYLAVASAVGTYAILVTVETAELSGDIRLLLMALLAVTVFWLMILRIKPLNVVEKAALYVTATVLVYLDTTVLHDESRLALFNWAAILTAAAGTMLRLGFSRDRRFELTPLDLIVLFVALIVPSLPDAFALPHGGSLGVIKLVVLFYAIEVLVSRVEMRVVWLRIGIASILTGLIIRPLF